MNRVHEGMPDIGFEIPESVVAEQISYFAVPQPCNLHT